MNDMNEVEPRRKSIVRDRLVAALTNGPYTRPQWLKAARCGIDALDRHFEYLITTGVVVEVGPAKRGGRCRYALSATVS